MILSLPGQSRHGQPEDISRAPLQVSWLGLAGAEELLSSAESSVPTATSCKGSREKVFLKGPAQRGTLRSPVRGRLRASQRLSWRAAKAAGPKVDKWDGPCWDAGSSVVAVKPAAVREGKESKAWSPESNPPSIWCPDPPPQMLP